MPKSIVFIALLFFPATVAVTPALGLQAVDAEAFKELTLVIGEQHVLSAEGVDSFSESTRGIVEIKIPKNGKQLVITALRAGNTSLLLLDADGNQKQVTITVFSRNPGGLIEELKEIIGPSGGLQFRQVGAKVFVDGTVPSESELARIEQIVALYPGQAQLLARVGVTVVPRTNIRLDLTFVEFHTSDDLYGGIKWPGSIGDGEVNFSYDLMTGTPEASYRVVNQAVPALHAAQASGKARIRKQAHLMTTDGSSAIYSSGGEINIPIIGSQTAELRTVPYGCTLKVLPHIDMHEKLVDLQVEAEVSELTETNQSAPGRTISKVSTLVHLGLGQSIVLSGLDSHTESKTKSGLPFVSRIPIIGLLFGTHQRRSEKVTGIIAITPVVLENVGRDSRRQINEALEKFKKFKG